MCYVPMTSTVSNKRTKMVSFRASEEEIQRLKALCAELIEQNRYLKESDILRELVGLENSGLITDATRQKLLPIAPGDDLETAREWLTADSERQKRASDVSDAIAKFSGNNLAFDAKRSILESLEVRIETDGRERWRIYFGVTFPKLETGHSALNFQLFSAERPVCKDGRWFRFRAG